jgi:hypothetical protein
MDAPLPADDGVMRHSLEGLPSDQEPGLGW